MERIMNILSLILFDFEWWQLLLVLLTLAAVPLFRAFAAVMVGWCLKPDIAKLALPLIFPVARRLRASRKKEKDFSGGSG